MIEYLDSLSHGGSIVYRRIGDTFEYDGEFEKYLLSIGVRAEHIQRMKEKKLQDDRDKYFLKKECEEKSLLVPLQKVIGTSRGTVGNSVFENVREIQGWERDHYRFEKCFKYLEKMSLNELIRSYENLSCPVKMVYYKDDDEYFLTSDGNHRTLTAMLLGAEYIKANVTVMVADKEKKEKYLAESIFYNKYNIASIVASGRRGCKIIFSDGDRYYEVNGYKGIRGNENCYDIINRLSIEIERDRKISELYLKIPIRVRSVLRYVLGNTRTLQYIEKNSPQKHYIVIRLHQF